MLGTGYQQEVHLDRLFDDVAEYNLMIDNPTQLPGVVDIAVRTALTPGAGWRTSPSRTTSRSPTRTKIPMQHVAPARPPATAPIYLAAPGRPGEEDLRAPRDGAQRGREGRHPGRCGCAARARRGARASPTRWARRSSRRCPARRSIPDDSPYADGRHRPARHAAGRGAGGRLRHAADGRDQLPVHPAPAGAGQGPGGADRGRPDPGRASGCRPRSRWSATPRRRWHALLPLLKRKDGPPLPARSTRRR